ncbi:MAG: ester cyclase [Caldilineaceae bacterium]
MSPNEIKALLYRLNDEIMNEGKLEVIEEIFDANYAARYGTYLENADYGYEAVKNFYHFAHAEYADFKVSINHLIAEGELAASNWSCVGIYQGEPTERIKPGQKVTWSGTSWFTVRNGKILERWAYRDDLTAIE